MCGLQILTQIIDSAKVIVMRLFIAVFILILNLQTWTKADDIKDFQIEGISLGDSLLDYMSENLIRKEINNKDITVYYENKYVSISAWEIRNKFKIYDDLGVVFDPNDKNYEIIGLEGTLYFKNINQCHKRQKEIAKEIKKSLSLDVKEDIWDVQKKRLPNHLASLNYIDFNLKEDLTKGSIRLACYDRKDNNRRDLLYVSINTAEFDLYLQKKADR